MSLHHGDWTKILAGLGGAATAIFAPYLLPGLFGAAGAGASAGGAALAGEGLTGLAAGGAMGAPIAGLGTGAAATGAGLGFSSLLAPATSAGLGLAASGAKGSPTEMMTTPGQLPPLSQQSDPFDILRQIKSMKQGGF